MKKVVVLFVLLSGTLCALSKTKEFGTWIELEFTKELFKKFELSFIPEIRLQDDFTIDEYLFDGRLGFEPVKFLELAATYRVNTDIRNKGNVVSKRFIFDATGKKGIGRFDLSLRTRFTNYTDVAEEDKANYFRTRLKMAYDIKGNKLRPYASYELFRNTTEKEYRKGRLDIGVSRKLGKLHRIGIYYRLQDYYTNRNSINIIGIDYRFKI